MPSEQVLISIVTAANMAGLEEAQAGFMGFTPQVLMAGAALAGLVFVGKSALENYEAQEKATKDLEQAYATQNDTLAAHKKEIEAFLETNKRFIDDQYDVQAALAMVVRAGNNEADAMRILNDALDLSVAKHSSVSEAANMLVLAEAGNSRGLRFLGITTTEYNAIMKSTLSLEEKHAALLALVEPKSKDLRKATSELSQEQRALNKDWQDFSGRIGPLVTGALDDVVKVAEQGVEDLTALANLVENIIGAPGKIISAFQGHPHPAGGRPVYTGRRATGGSVDPFGSYLVGERGPETLHMGATGGYVTPGSGGTVIHNHINIDRGAFIDGPSTDRLANMIAQRLSYTTGR